MKVCPLVLGLLQVAAAEPAVNDSFERGLAGFGQLMDAMSGMNLPTSSEWVQAENDEENGWVGSPFTLSSFAPAAVVAEQQQQRARQEEEEKGKEKVTDVVDLLDGLLGNMLHTFLHDDDDGMGRFMNTMMGESHLLGGPGLQFQFPAHSGIEYNIVSSGPFTSFSSSTSVSTSPPGDAASAPSSLCETNQLVCSEALQRQGANCIIGNCVTLPRTTERLDDQDQIQHVATTSAEPAAAVTKPTKDTQDEMLLQVAELTGDARETLPTMYQPPLSVIICGAVLLGSVLALLFVWVCCGRSRSKKRYNTGLVIISQAPLVHAMGFTTTTNITPEKMV